MNALALLLPFAKDLLQKLFPDPAQQADAQLKLATLVQNGELAQLAAETDLAKGQLAVNLAEAQQARKFITWREAFGWVCVLTVAFKFILGPGVALLCQIAGHPITLPVLDSSELNAPFLAMLGLGGIGAYEKVKAK